MWRENKMTYTESRIKSADVSAIIFLSYEKKKKKKQITPYVVKSIDRI